MDICSEFMSRSLRHSIEAATRSTAHRLGSAFWLKTSLIASVFSHSLFHLAACLLLPSPNCTPQSDRPVTLHHPGCCFKSQGPRIRPHSPNTPRPVRAGGSGASDTQAHVPGVLQAHVQICNRCACNQLLRVGGENGSHAGDFQWQRPLRLSWSPFLPGPN